MFRVFAVFRLEIHEHEVRDARDELNVLHPRDRPDFVRERADYTPPKELLDKVENILKEKPEYFAPYQEHVEKHMKRLQKAIDRKNEIKAMMILPLLYMATLLMTSGVLEHLN